MDRFAQELDQADETYLCHFPENAAKEPGINITIQDLADRCAHAQVIQEDETAAKFLADRGPAVYLFMSSKDIYKLKNIVKSFFVIFALIIIFVIFCDFSFYKTFKEFSVNL